MSKLFHSSNSGIIAVLCLLLLKVSFLHNVSAANIHVYTDQAYDAELHAFDHDRATCGTSTNIADEADLSAGSQWYTLSAQKNGYSTFQLGFERNDNYRSIELCGGSHMDKKSMCSGNWSINNIFKAKCETKDSVSRGRYILGTDVNGDIRMCPIQWNADGVTWPTISGRPIPDCSDTCESTRRRGLLRGV